MTSAGESTLWLGTRRDGDARVTLPQQALLRHMMALGSSGSGKTVLSKVVVEECVRHGVPAICIDPQGDICSLLERPEDLDALRARGIDPALAEQFAERADVVVWTPGADVGVPLCADPVDAHLAELGADERARALSRIAATLTSLLGYELGSDDGDGLCAALDQACTARLERGAPLAALRDIADELTARRNDGFAELQRFVSPRKLEQALQRLARLDVGARRRLFHDGFSIDIDLLLGNEPTALPGKTRVSVIYLNALEQQEDKELVVAALADRLYRWMLDHPSRDLQALFYIDEVAPFIPPVRKPSCKMGLSLLFKQARKYGLGCLMATQNPGDVDYKAMAQFGTWAIGRLTTRQDRKKVEPTVTSLAGDAGDDVMEELPRLKAGEFVLLSPDHLDAPAPLACRWLLTAHDTFDERRIRAAADALWRERFILAARADVDPKPARDEPRKVSDEEPPIAEPTKQPQRPTAAPRPTPQPSRASMPEAPREGPTGTVFMAPAETMVAEPAPSVAESQPQPEERWELLLLGAPSMDAKAMAERMGVSAATARRRLRTLVDHGLAATFRRGRATRYWAPRGGLRPDLGLDAPVAVASATVQSDRARAIAEGHCRTPVLGVLGARERIAQLTLMHMPLVHVPFEEKVERSLLERALGPRHDRIRGSVYMHPVDQSFLTLDAASGVRFSPRPNPYASGIQDLDGAVTWHALAPATLSLDLESWQLRKPLDATLSRFQDDYPTASTGAPSFVFMPYWHLVLEQDGGSNYRVLDFDGVTGRPIERASS
jgi:Helicase HerA-like C-terminal